MAEITINAKIKNKYILPTDPSQDPLSILLEGEVVYVEKNNKIQIYIGDGVKKFSELTPIVPFKLSDLESDASNVTISQDLKDKIINSRELILIDTVNTSGLKQSYERASREPGAQCVVVVRHLYKNVKYDTLLTEITRSITGITYRGEFREDGSVLSFVILDYVLLASGVLSPIKYTATNAASSSDINTYTLVKHNPAPGFASTYVLTENGTTGRGTINIPLDEVLESSSIKEVTIVNKPYPGAAVGDKYIEFIFQNNPQPQYLPVKDLVDVYTAGNHITVSSSNSIAVNTTTLFPAIQTNLTPVFEKKGVAKTLIDQKVAEILGSDFIINCN